MSQNSVLKYLKNPTNKALLLLDQPWLPLPQLYQMISHLIISTSVFNHSTSRKIVTLLTTPPNVAVSDAYSLFRFIPHPSTSLYNTMIKTFIEHNHPQEALLLCRKMMGSYHFPNNYTFSFVFRACGDINWDVSLGLMYHALVVKLGWGCYDFVRNGLVHFYVKSNCMGFAKNVFNESSPQHLLIENALGQEIDEISVTRLTTPPTLSSGYGSTFLDVITWTEMINGYLKAGEVSVAKELFDKMPERNDVSWSVMINGYSKLRLFKEARECFVDMVNAGFRANHAAVVGALTACSGLGDLDRGRWIHEYVRKRKMELDTVLGTALVDMYAKCGCIDMACSVFEEIPCKDVVAYTSLISGLADHGEGRKALEVFVRMKTEGIRPNEVTFVGVLSACSRAGLVEEGLRIFESMKVEYGIEPTVKHYGCLVDLLGRSGRLEQAKDIVSKMPMEPDQYVVGALLNACRVHGDIDIEKEMVNWLENTFLGGVHVLISNIYATSDQWGDVQKVRERMQEKYVEKTPGYSSCI